MPRFTTLYSGSSGNAAVVEQGGSYILVDMGSCCRTTVAALAKVGLEPEGLAGILITHEHSDHIKGLMVFLKRYPVPVYASNATLQELARMNAVPPGTALIQADGKFFDVADFKVKSFATSHDAAGCCGYRIMAPGGSVMAIATDLGVITDSVLKHLRNANLVALEANYDIEQLRHSPYPYYLKRRISSVRGHLSNVDCADVVAKLVAEGCRKMAFCHLSKENNHPNLVLDAVNSALFREGIALPEDCVLQVAHRYDVSPWIDF